MILVLYPYHPFYLIYAVPWSSTPHAPSTTFKTVHRTLIVFSSEFNRRMDLYT